MYLLHHVVYMVMIGDKQYVFIVKLALEIME